jgi:hypothetical protein
MAETTTVTTLPEEVIAQDAQYEAAIHGGRSAEVKRDRLRWEWTRCPLGPGLSNSEYARQVKRDESSIRASIEAHETVISGGDPTITEEAACLYGERHLIDAPEVEQEEPTDEEVAEHYKAKITVTRSAAYALVCETFAALRNVTIKTVTGNATWTPLTQEAMRRIETGVDLDAADAEAKIKAIAKDVLDDDAQREARVRQIKTWMAKNRAVPGTQVTLNDARKMMVRIEDRMARTGETFTTAARYQREWDWKHREAERIKNEQRAAARQAVLDLAQAAAEVRGAAERVVKAVRRIEVEAVPIAAEERDLYQEDLDVAEAAIRLARVALRGESGTDWDAALARLADRP